MSVFEESGFVYSRGVCILFLPGDMSTPESRLFELIPADFTFRGIWTFRESPLIILVSIVFSFGPSFEFGFIQQKNRLTLFKVRERLLVVNFTENKFCFFNIIRLRTQSIYQVKKLSNMNPSFVISILDLTPFLPLLTRISPYTVITRQQLVWNRGTI